MKTLLIVSFAFSMLGCAKVDVMQMGHAAPAKSKNCHLDVYASESEVPRKFVTVCMISASTGRTILSDRSAGGAINKTKPKACECGADAIIVRQAESEGLTWDEGPYGKAAVQAIKYTE